MNYDQHCELDSPSVGLWQRAANLANHTWRPSWFPSYHITTKAQQATNILLSALALSCGRLALNGSTVVSAGGAEADPLWLYVAVRVCIALVLTVLVGSLAGTEVCVHAGFGNGVSDCEDVAQGVLVGVTAEQLGNAVTVVTSVAVEVEVDTLVVVTMLTNCVVFQSVTVCVAVVVHSSVTVTIFDAGLL